ncbi:hypothetical protein FF098_003795 [Parvularcula flava]|uniref:Uncharacterized protein n=2 Tax=Aquisalinus luteolus TaxID=1566827 RepID=A0ABX0HKX1_9PROT|nr:hypothetical protein [Aquisalinus luteolus]NHK27026.1 hypothetical protein [Aquisalinus luteolus]
MIRLALSCLAATIFLGATARAEIPQTHWPFPWPDIALPMENGAKLFHQSGIVGPESEDGWYLTVSEEKMKGTLEEEKELLIASGDEFPDYRLGEVRDMEIGGVMGITAEYFDPQHNASAIGYWVPNRLNYLVRIDFFFPNDTPVARAAAKRVIDGLYHLEKGESGFEKNPFRFESEFRIGDPAEFFGNGWEVHMYQYDHDGSKGVNYLIQRKLEVEGARKIVSQGKVRMLPVTDENREELTGEADCMTDTQYRTADYGWYRITCKEHNITTEGRDWRGIMYASMKNNEEVFKDHYRMRQVIGDRVLEVYVECYDTDEDSDCFDQAAVMAYKGIRLNPTPTLGNAAQ